MIGVERNGLRSARSRANGLDHVGLRAARVPAASAAVVPAGAPRVDGPPRLEVARRCRAGPCRRAPRRGERRRRRGGPGRHERPSDPTSQATSWGIPLDFVTHPRSRLAMPASPASSLAADATDRVSTRHEVRHDGGSWACSRRVPRGSRAPTCPLLGGRASRLAPTAAPASLLMGAALRSHSRMRACGNR